MHACMHTITTQSNVVNVVFINTHTDASAAVAADLS